MIFIASGGRNEDPNTQGNCQPELAQRNKGSPQFALGLSTFFCSEQTNCTQQVSRKFFSTKGKAE